MRDFQKLTQSSNARRGQRQLGYLLVALVLVVGFAIAAAFTPFWGDKNLAVESAGRGSGVFETLGNVSGEPRNILVVGVDERPEVEGSRTDTLMLVRVYPDTGNVRLVSIPRDLFVEVEPGVEDKINAAYSYDGISGTIGAVENFTSVHIDHYAVVDFTGFEAMVDAVGGLTIDIEEGQVPPNWTVKEDAQHLNGRRTLIYARYRNTEAGDLDRVRRQREVLASLRSRALRWRSAKKLPDITRAVVENVETDMSLAEVISLGRAMAKHGPNGRMTSTQLQGIPETLEGSGQVLVPDQVANEYILREFR